MLASFNMNKKIIIGLVALLVIMAIGVFFFSQHRKSTVVTTNPLVINHTEKQTKDLNPGTSINPIDQGKSISSDQFKYTLLDVREDKVEPALGSYPIYLVKLEVERIAPNDSKNPDSVTGLSVAEVDLSTKENYDRIKDKGQAFKTDVGYPRTKLGTSLGEDITSLKMGEKVTGYYVFNATTPTNPEKLYFDVRNYGVDAVNKGTSLKIAGVFKIK